MTTAEKKPEVAIVDDTADRATALQRATGLELIADDNKEPPCRFTLKWLDNKLTLRDHHSHPPLQVTADFTGGDVLHRQKFGGGHGQPIARAVKTRDRPLICDATAGFGKDAFVFASLDCHVVLLEQSIVIHAMLADAIDRALQDPLTEQIADRMTLYHVNSAKLPDAWPHDRLPDVIYLDPMYPEGKRATKKEIQTLRHLLDAQADEESLLAAARSTARRVVVKRPRKAKPLADQQPSGSVTSPKTRFDIYGR